MQLELRESYLAEPTTGSAENAATYATVSRVDYGLKVMSLVRKPWYQRRGFLRVQAYAPRHRLSQPTIG